MKRNALYAVIEVKRVHYLKKGKAKVLRDEIIELEYHPEREDGKQDLKKIQNEKKMLDYKVLTNTNQESGF
ncbi:MAG: hypothetical protein ACOXZV_01110 [Bacteroidales bacterium]|jgi:hypothetical protein